LNDVQMGINEELLKYDYGHDYGHDDERINNDYSTIFAS